MAARQRHRVLAAGPDRGRPYPFTRPGRVRRTCVGLRRGPMDVDRGARGRCTRPRAFKRVVLPIRVPGPGQLRRQGVVCHAQGIRWPRREEGLRRSRGLSGNQVPNRQVQSPWTGWPGAGLAPPGGGRTIAARLIGPAIGRSDANSIELGGEFVDSDHFLGIAHSPTYPREAVMRATLLVALPLVLVTAGRSSSSSPSATSPTAPVAVAATPRPGR